MTLAWQALDSALLTRLGWTLLHFVWQGIAAAALLAILLAATRRRSAQVRYLVCCVALLLMAAAPVVTFVSIDVAQPPSAVTERPAPFAVPGDQSRTVADASDAATPAQRVAETDSASALRLAAGPQGRASSGAPMPGERSVSADEPGVDSGAGGSSDAHAFGVAAKQEKPNRDDPVSPSWGSAIAARLQPWLPHAVAVWLIGVVLCSAWHLLGWLGIQRLRRAASPLGETEPELTWRSAAERLARLFRLGRPVRLLRPIRHVGPIVFGVLRPVVLIPAALLSGLSPAQVEAILAHEFAHIRRHDYLVNLLQTLIETLLFYHPAVWWVSGRIRIEREHCCDDLAVAALSGELSSASSFSHRAAGPRVDAARHAYASALAELAELSIAHSGIRRRMLSRLAPAKRIAPGAKMNLLTRIRRIIGPAAAEGPRRATWLAGALILAGLLIVIPLACQHAEPRLPAQPAAALPHARARGQASPATQGDELLKLNTGARKALCDGCQAWHVFDNTQPAPLFAFAAICEAISDPTYIGFDGGDHRGPELRLQRLVDEFESSRLTVPCGPAGATMILPPAGRGHPAGPARPVRHPHEALGLCVGVLCRATLVVPAAKSVLGS